MTQTTDGSSSAAHCAQPKVQKTFSQRIADLFPLFSAKPSMISDDTATNGSIPDGGLGNLSKLRVEDVAVPRADIISVEQSSTKDELIGVFRTSSFTRLPIYDETMDNPLGLIHLKDLALKHGFNGAGGRFNLKRLIRPLLFAPPSMPIGVLLQKMQTERIHMALVIDEYGGVDGLVTLEDLVEQVVGEIIDEHDVAEDALWQEEKPGIYVVQARAPLEDFEKVLGEDLLEDAEDEEIDTLGGLVFMLIGRVPARGEVILHPKGIEFEILDADPRRIKRLRVCRTTAQP